MPQHDAAPPPDEPTSQLDRTELCARLARAMQARRLLEEPAPPAALRWVETFVSAYGQRFATLDAALEIVAALREEAVIVPALELERLRNRQVLFFLDTIAQYVDDQPELLDLPLGADVAEIAR